VPDTDPFTHDYLTVRELADLLRVKERKVYYLAASGQVPCTRATGRLLFPADEIQAWLAEQRGGPERPAARPGVFLGSHDPLLSWALGQSQCGLATFFDGSLDGLERFRAGEGIATGLHVYEAATGGWNTSHVRQFCSDLDVVLIGWAGRGRGLVFRPEDSGIIRGLRDLAGRRLAGRQPYSGTDVLLGDLLAGEGLTRGDLNLTSQSRNEADAVLAVAQGNADVAFGLKAVALQFGLSYLSIIEERFDLLVERRAYFEPPFQRFLSFCSGSAIRDHATALGGYDLRRFGQIVWNS